MADTFAQRADRTRAESANAQLSATGQGTPKKSFVAQQDDRLRGRADMVLQLYRDTTAAQALTAADQSDRSPEVLGTHMPADVFLTDGEVKSAFYRAEAKRKTQTMNPRLAAWATQEPTNAVIAKEFADELGTLSTTVGAVTYGVRNIGVTAWSYMFGYEAAERRLGQGEQARADAGRSVFDIATEEAQTNRSAEGRNVVGQVYDRAFGILANAFDPTAGIRRTIDRSMRAQVAPDDATMDQLAVTALGELRKEMGARADIEADYRRNAAQQRVTRAITDIDMRDDLTPTQAFWRKMGVVATGDGVAWLALTVAESSAPLAAAVAATLLTKNPAAGAIVGGFGGGAYDYGQSWQEIAKDAGFDVTTEEGMKAFIKDPMARELVRDRAQARGIVIGALGALSGGVASRQMMQSVAGELLVQGLAQAVMGSAGEALGMLAAEQELDLFEIAVEGLAEMVTVPVEVFGVGGQALNAEVRRRKEAEGARRFFEALADTSENSELRKKAPKKYREAVEALTKNGPVAEVQIDTGGLEQLFQSGALTMEKLVQIVPSLTPEQVTLAITEGTDIAIPTGDYAAFIAGTDLDAQLRQHMRLNGSMTAAEIAAMGDMDMMRELSEGIREVEAGVRSLERTLETENTRLVEELTAAGRTPSVAKAEAMQLVVFADVAARRMGMPVDEFLKKHPLPRVFRSEDGTAPVRAPVDRLQELRTAGGPEAEVIERAAAAAGLTEAATNEELAEALQAYANPTDEGRRLNQSVELRRGSETLAPYGVEPGTKARTRDVAKALAARTRDLFGEIDRTDRSPEAVEKIADMMVDEVVFEIEEMPPEQSAAGWYTTKFQRALDRLGDLRYPEFTGSAGAMTSSDLPGVKRLKNPKNARRFFTALLALTSDGAKVVDNFRHAIALYDGFRQTGVVSIDGRGGMRNASMVINVASMNRLLNERGPSEMHTYLMREATVAEIRAELRKEGVEKPLPTMAANETLPYAAAIFGPKLGSFYANLMGAEGYLTMDRWWTRTFNRMRGDTLPKVSAQGIARLRKLVGLDEDISDEGVLMVAAMYADDYAAKGFKNGTEIEKAANTLYKAAFTELQDAPMGPSDRAFMIATAKRATEKLRERGHNVTVADLQAVLWYYEKRLYNVLGTKPTDDISYEEAAERATADNLGGPERPLAGGVVLGQEARSDGPAVGEADLRGKLDAEFFSRPGWAILTYELSETFIPDARQRARRNANERPIFLAKLEELGIPYRPVTGFYGGGPEQSFIVIADEETAAKLGRQFGQDSVLTRDGFVYTRGAPRPNTRPTGRMLFGQAAIDAEYYSITEDGQAFALEMDFETSGPGKPTTPVGMRELAGRPQLPVDADGNVVLYHWSDKPLTAVDPDKADSGPLKNAVNRGSKVSFWGINPRSDLRAPGTGYVRESGLGKVLHTARVDAKKLYPWHEDPDGLRPTEGTSGQQDAAYTKAIREAGYLGVYYTEDGSGRAPLGNVATLFEELKVEQYDGTLESIYTPEEIVMPLSGDETAQLAQLAAMTEENREIVRRIMSQIDEKFGTKSGDNVKKPENIASKARRPSILAKKPWFTMAHIRDSYRFKTALKDFRDLPGIMEILAENGVTLVKSDTAKFMAPGEWGWRIIAFDLRMPNGQLVEYYLPMEELEAAKDEGHVLFEKWRNLTQEELVKQAGEYLADLRASRDLYQTAFDAALSRLGIDIPAAEASFAKAVAALSEAQLQPVSTSEGSGMSSAVSGTDFQTPSYVLMQNPPAKNSTAPSVSLETSAENVMGDTSSVADAQGIGTNELAVKEPFRLASGYEPLNTVPAYKLFRRGFDGQLYPLFVDAKTPVPVGQWLEATAGELTDKGKVKSKIGPLAYRPGWHAGDLPIATHIGAKSDPGLKAPDLRPRDQVWALVEMADDVDWQSEADARAEVTKAGEPLARTAHITDQVPLGGHYRYKTNPNMTGEWLIGGHMRVVRVLEDAEVEKVNAAAGVADLRRAPPEPVIPPTNLPRGTELFQSAPQPELDAFLEGSKAREINYHATRGEYDFSTFRNLTHVGTARAARQRLDRREMFTQQRVAMDKRALGERIIPMYLAVKNPLHVGTERNETGDNWQTNWDTLWQAARTVEKTDPALAKRMDAVLDEMADYAKWEGGHFGGYDTVMAMLEEAGYDSISYRNVVEDEGSLSYVVFRPNQIKSPWAAKFDTASGDFLQQDKRGSIFFPDGAGAAPVISLFAKADLSTILHESGHYFLRTYEQLAQTSPEIAAEMEQLKGWWMDNADKVAKDAGGPVTAAHVELYLTKGTAGDAAVDAAIYVGLQEQFARAYETYLFEGRSPSERLSGVFEMFSAWLVAVYRAVTKGQMASRQRVKMDERVRGVFDRMLATDEELQKARAENKHIEMIAKSAEELGVTQPEFDEIMRLSVEAQEDARRTLQAELMKPMLDQRREQESEVRTRAKATAEETVNARPVHRAIEWLANGRWLDGEQPENTPDLRMDTQLLIDAYGPAILPELPRGRRPVYVKDSGLSADEVATWFGFATGKDLIDAMKDAPARDAAIKAETERLIREELGDPLVDGTAAELAIAALNGNKRGDLIAAELRALGKQASRSLPRTTRSVARLAARRRIAMAPVRDAVSYKGFLQSMQRAAERAQQALAKGDIDTAYNEKRKELLNHALYMEAREASENVAKWERKVARLKKPGTRKNIDGEYLAAIDEIMDRYDFRRLSQTAERRRGSLNAYIEMMRAAGRENELAIPASVIAEAQRRPYKTLPYQELRGVIDALDNIEHTGRRKKKLLDAKRERDLDIAVADAVTEAAQFVKGSPPARTRDSERRGSRLRHFANLLLNADTILREYGGFEMGKMYDLLKADIDAAANRAQDMRVQAAERINQLYDVYTARQRKMMATKSSHSQLVTANDKVASFAQWDFISMALNMGNETNLERLMDKDNGYGYTPGQIEYIKAQLSSKDWEFVQSVWDYIDEFWPMIAEREKRQTGVVPTKVEAVELELADGRRLRGGYYPIKYDTRIKSNLTAAEEIVELQMNMMAGRFGKAQTRNGFTKERAAGSGGRTLEIGMQVFHQHIASVIHDITHSEATANTWRVLQHPEMISFFEKNGRAADREALELWVQDVATGNAIGGGDFGRLAMRVKTNFTLSKLAFNISTVLVQLTGVAQSAVVVGKLPLMKAYAQYAGGREKWGMLIKERSSYMAERETTFHRDIYEMMADQTSSPLDSSYRKTQEMIGKIGFFLMQKVQYYGVDIPTWLAAYNTAVEKGKTDAEAVVYADRMVARAQASGLMSDRSAFERGTLSKDTRMNGFVRLFTALGSYMFAKGNIAYERVNRGRAEIADAGFSGRAAVAAVSTAFDLALLFTLEAILYAAIKGTLPGDDDDEDGDGLGDEWAKFVARETAFAMLGSIPVLRDMVGTMQGFSGGGAYGSANETIAKPFVEALQGEVDGAAIKALSNAAGLAVGFPSAATNRLVDGMFRMQEGDDVAPIEFLMGRR